MVKVMTINEMSRARKRSDKAEQKRAISDFNKDPNLIHRPLGTLYLSFWEAEYLQEILPGWIEYYQDTITDHEDETAINLCKTSVAVLQPLLQELSSMKLQNRTDHIAITLTPFNETTLSSILEMQAELHEEQDMDDAKTAKAIRKYAERLRLATLLGLRIERVINGGGHYNFTLNQLHAQNLPETA